MYTVWLPAMMQKRDKSTQSSWVLCMQAPFTSRHAACHWQGMRREMMMLNTATSRQVTEEISQVKMWCMAMLSIDASAALCELEKRAPFPRTPFVQCCQMECGSSTCEISSVQTPPLFAQVHHEAVNIEVRGAGVTCGILATLRKSSCRFYLRNIFRHQSSAVRSLLKNSV